jgi:biotin-(acetyl-CoA carboxylase) ligase
VEFARRLYARLEEVLDLCAERGFEALRPAFEARFAMAGRRVRVTDLGGVAVEGIALGIDALGALRLRRDDGGESRVVAGDVTVAKEET